MSISLKNRSLISISDYTPEEICHVLDIAEARGVTLTGLFYPLENANLESFFPLGVSNSFVDGTANVSVKSGTLLIIHDIP